MDIPSVQEDMLGGLDVRTALIVYSVALTDIGQVVELLVIGVIDRQAKHIRPAVRVGDLELLGVLGDVLAKRHFQDLFVGNFKFVSHINSFWLV
jgi:hypothetical protein